MYHHQGRLFTEFGAVYTRQTIEECKWRDKRLQNADIVARRKVDRQEAMTDDTPNTVPTILTKHVYRICNIWLDYST